jgi:type II secretory pathway pseudopilin PulG
MNRSEFRSVFDMTRSTFCSKTPLVDQGRHSGTPHLRSVILDSKSDREDGYALVSLLVVMSLMALFAMAAASNVRQQAQREREKEAIFRGEQVADAIRSYYRYRRTQGVQGVNSLPTTMDQLLEGIPRGTKKLQILRSEAARDPLSSSGEWKLISPTSQDFAALVRSLTIYSGGVPPTPRDQQFAALIPQMTNILDTKSSGTAPGGEDDSASSSGPFLGVASRSQRNSVLTYYGIDRHDEWIFTPLFR